MDGTLQAGPNGPHKEGGEVQHQWQQQRAKATLTRHCTARVLELPLEGHEQGLRVSDGLSDARVGYGDH